MKIPNWHEEIETFRMSANILIVSGNILDSFIYPSNDGIYILSGYLENLTRDIGYKCVTVYDNINGFRGRKESIESLSAIAGDEGYNNSKVGGNIPFQYSPNSINACSIVKKALSQRRVSTAIIMDMASRYIPSPDSTRMEDIDSFHVLMNAGRCAMPAPLADGSPTQNILIMLVDKENDLPVWFYMNNPSVRRIQICRPSDEQRREYIEANHFRDFFDPMVFEADMEQYRGKTEELKKIKREMVALTDDLMFSDIISIQQLCRNKKFRINEFSKAIKLFRYGIVSESIWDRLSREDVARVEAALFKNIIGQDRAVRHTTEVLKRIESGMSNISSGNFNKPKGIMFFAGPTGTGKTEMAKQLAENLFLNKDALVVFDMSEYSSPNSDQRLLGAPPGYIGYESGGQLTNAALRNPFSIFLFDEIEKAEPGIMDKFLQILGEGRLTDGSGRTAYFNESIIIFTSNLGAYVRDPDNPGKRKPAFSTEDNYDVIRRRVTSEIESYFKNTLGRPEILNRIGDNIVVFNFIEGENVGRVLDLKIKKFCNAMKENNSIDVLVESTVREKLIARYNECFKDKGGRGIENMMESALINPVSRYIYDNCINGGIIRVFDIDFDNDGNSELGCTRI